MSHILIITGGKLNIEFARDYCKTLSFDKVFAVDRGLEYSDCLGLFPDYIMGDFDTVDSNLLSEYRDKVNSGRLRAEIISYEVMKDESDTELAVHKAIALAPSKITILGGLGNRYDHSLMNMALLRQIEGSGIEGEIIDEHNRIQLLDSEIKNDRRRSEAPYAVHMQIVRDGFFKCNKKKYLSLFPLTTEVLGLTITGVLYPLSDCTLSQGSTLTLSNQITEERAHILIKKGRLLIIEAFD